MPRLQWSEVRQRAIQFVRDHADDYSERADKQTFWNRPFFNVFGLRRASIASFEANVRNLKGNVAAIDLLWRGRLLVEHKSLGEDLDFELQAFEYVRRYSFTESLGRDPTIRTHLSFANLVLYDLQTKKLQLEWPLTPEARLQPASVHFRLSDLPGHIRHFAFMLGQAQVRLHAEDPANEKAYRRMCQLHDALKVGGFNPRDLERLLNTVCLFAEDMGCSPDAFTQFVRTQTREDGGDLGAKLNELFDWLNQPQADTVNDDTIRFMGFDS